MVLAGSGIDNRFSVSAASVNIQNAQKVRFFWGGGVGVIKCMKFAHSRKGCSCCSSFTSEATELVLTDFGCGRIYNTFVSEFNL